MRLLRWLTRMLGISLVLGLISSFAISLKGNSSQPVIPQPRLSVWQWFSRRFLGGFGTQKDPFEEAHKGPIEWPNFREEVTDQELRRLDQEFFIPVQDGILDVVLRRGHADDGAEETVGQHVRRLRELDAIYQEPMNLDARDLLELQTMHGSHELAEIVTLDTRRFTLVGGRSERRKKIKNFKPVSVQSERRRMVREWKRERPFIFVVTQGLEPRERLIVLYLFDRFYLGRDRIAKFGRQVHYFQPAYDISNYTADPLIIEWFMKVAFAYLTNERLIGDLEAIKNKREGELKST